MVEARGDAAGEIQIVVLLPWYSPYPYKNVANVNYSQHATNHIA